MSEGCHGNQRGSEQTVADILIRFHQVYLDRHCDSLRMEERKALQSIIQCRTPVMGGRSYRCSHCEKDHFAWHSCNHRLCPRCGSTETQAWVADKLEDRLPVDHHMVTFTLPSQLRKLCRYSTKDFLRRFFASSSQAVKDVLKDKRHRFQWKDNARQAQRLARPRRSLRLAA